MHPAQHGTTRRARTDVLAQDYRGDEYYEIVREVTIGGYPGLRRVGPAGSQTCKITVGLGNDQGIRVGAETGRLRFTHRRRQETRYSHPQSAEAYQYQRARACGCETGCCQCDEMRTGPGQP